MSDAATGTSPSSRYLRPAADRPRPTELVLRGLIVLGSSALGLWALERYLPGFSIDGAGWLLLAAALVGLVNAFVWPLLATFVVPISVLTLGLASTVLRAVVVGLVLDALPGVEMRDAVTPLWIVLGLAVVSSVVSAALAVDDDAWHDRHLARLARRRLHHAVSTDVPGIVFVQLDGVAETVLVRALRSGDAPTIARWVRDGSHRVVGWETGWSSQTGVSQCGILHGSTVDMPSFRWLDKETGHVVVSNRPRSAAAIERAHSNGDGLLAHHGSSYGNLFSGDAERAVLTMSEAGRRKEGHVGAGYIGYFARPSRALRTAVATVVDVIRERRAALLQARRHVEPRIHRSWTYSLLRAFTTVVSRDVCVEGVLYDVAEGRSAIYVDLLGYDEVAHHSGPERADTLAVLRDCDRLIGRIERSFRWAPRPYHLVVLSDHGQTQGLTFEQRTGETLAALVGRLCGGATSGDRDAERGRTESAAWARRAGGADVSPTPQPALDTPTSTSGLPTVLASGALGLVSFPGSRHRLTRDEIDARHPGLVDALATHPEIGFVLVATDSGSLVLGGTGSRNLATGEVSGDDPLAPYGDRAVEQVSEVDRYRTAGDLMINSRYDPYLDEVAAFETQVGSHGALGGPQTRPFLLQPRALAAPTQPIFTSVAMHRVLKGWLAEVGQPVRLPWLDAGAAPEGLDAIRIVNGIAPRERPDRRDAPGPGVPPAPLT